MSDTALTVVEHDEALAPMSMGGTFSAYKQMQTEIDRAMPDQIMTIQGRQFRKKGYWRAVRAAFNLKVWCVSEERIEAAGDWGYSALYRAEGRNGTAADGDGVCMASEKAERQRTIHNVRSHAHTRACNRAISNLVGFGEVSAEEVERDEHPVIEARVEPPKPAPTSASPAVDIDLLGGEPDFGPDASSAPNVYITLLTSRNGLIKSGERKGEQYTQFFIELSDGRKGSFFDGPMAVSAKAAYASKAPVIATFEQRGSYSNLTNLLRAD